MPRIRVVTDSAADIPESLQRQHDITVVPMRVRWGVGGYPDRGGITTDDVMARQREGGVAGIPEVESPSVEDFSRTYRLLRETCDGVISIHISSRLSDTLANAWIAREAFGPIGQGGPFPVAVVDSLSISMGLGWIVVEVAKAAERGLDLPRLVSLATRLTGLSHVAFFTEQTDILLASGHASRLTHQSEHLASMRPLFHLDEGYISVYEKTRTRPKARDSLYNFVEDFPGIGELAVLHTNVTQNDVEHLLTRIGAIYPRERVPIIQIGPALASWLGPDVLGVAVLEGEE
ncbi:MAG: DegV family protein [Chloroflexia bacterium]